MSSATTIGLALGGGGARGMAHILVCEVFDELGLKPNVIAGTSIGAVIGAAYAAGMTGAEMRASSCAFYAQRREVLTRLWRARPRAFADLLRGRSMSPQFDAERILEAFVPGFAALPDRFEDLGIPLKVIACDFYGWSETVLSEGALKPAIAASIAIPAIFKPVVIGGRVQIDGGACNPLPFDRIAENDLVIACDVAGGPTGQPSVLPRLMECVVGAAQISMQAIIAEKLRARHPDILVRPELLGVFVLDFLKTQAILDANVAFKDDLKRRIETALEQRRAARISAGELGYRRSAKKFWSSAVAAIAPMPE
jgi:NTE family protein